VLSTPFSMSLDYVFCRVAGAPLDHPDFGANLWVNAAEADGRPGIDDDNNGVVDDKNGAAFLNGVASGDVQDQNSHG
jgi:thermitase